MLLIIERMMVADIQILKYLSVILISLLLQPEMKITDISHTAQQVYSCE